LSVLPVWVTYGLDNVALKNFAHIKLIEGSCASLFSFELSRIFISLHQLLFHLFYLYLFLDSKEHVFCVYFQEVETDQFYNYFLHELSKVGYDGIFAPKSRARTMTEQERKHVDGCAIFFKKEKYVKLSGCLCCSCCLLLSSLLLVSFS
jgi:hypothetical protein